MVGARTVVALSSLLLTALVGLAPTVPANHPQPAHGDVVVFDHKTGNEWWVEVVVSGGASGSVQAVQAMDTGGAWTTLTKRSWGAWAQSFHIEAGHQVKFRATWSGGDLVESCWFTHPAGVEQCSTSTTTTTTGPTGFDAPFTGVRGNEWWVQANVGSNGPAISKVDVRIAPDGAWKPLAKQSWGPTAWAGSYHFPQGSVLQMRATASTGATDLSSCRQWVPPSGQDAAIVTCPGSEPPAFDATWSNVKGNEHWVEAVVKANQPIQMVLVTIDCNPHQDPYEMTFRADWGKWVLGSIPVPNGSTVTMTAVGPNGALDTSANYRWTQATVTEDCPEPWPQTGSFAQIRFENELREFDMEGNERYFFADGLVDITFTDGVGWRGTCQQRISEMDFDGTWTNVTETFPWELGPPTAAVPSPPGGAAYIETVDVCELSSFESTALARETRTFSVRDSSGDLREIDAYHAGSSSSGHFANYWYDARMGLMLDWREHSSGEHHIMGSRGWLLNTDYTFPTPP